MIQRLKERWKDRRVERQLRKQARRQVSLGQVGPRKGLVYRLSRYPAKLFGRMFKGLQTWLDVFSGSRRLRRDLVFGLPALLAVVGTVAATAVGHVRQVGAAQRYWTRGNAYLRDGDPLAAQTMLQKALVVQKNNNRDVVFSLARAYEDSGDIVRADALMESLAPVNAEGYPAAHRYLAVRMADDVSRNKGLKSVDAWRWHLEHASKSDTGSLDKAWGYYHLIVGDLAVSADYFRRAAVDEPRLWLQVAELEARMEDMDAALRTLAVARRQLEQQFLRDPGNAQNRLLYATSLFYIGDLPNAEKLLKEGLAEGDNNDFRQLLAAVFVRMFDAESEKEGGIDSAFKFLALALQYEPNYQAALTRLVAVARVSEDRLGEARETMRRQIAEGGASAMAHFALGSLEWIAGNMELAKLNMSQAVAMDPQLVVVANNLAYLISQEENPDLEVALNLANQAVLADPTNPDFLDTRATIYFLRGELALAAIDYEKALDRAADPDPIRMRLADIYRTMGDSATADEFERKVRNGSAGRGG